MEKINLLSYFNYHYPVINKVCSRMGVHAPLFTMSASYYHYLVNKTYNEVTLGLTVTNTVCQIKTAYDDLIGDFPHGIWARKDGVPLELLQVMPVVDKYLVANDDEYAGRKRYNSYFDRGNQPRPTTNAASTSSLL